MKRNTNRLLFLIGLFSATQVRFIGSIGIAELFVFLVAPFIFLMDFAKIRRDGFSTAVWLSLLCVFSCILSSCYNGTPFPAALRGVATCYSIFAYIVVYHRILPGNLKGLKWLFLGGCFSVVLNIFVFRRGFEAGAVADLSDAEAIEAIMSGPIFWINRLSPFLTLPTRGWYFQTPLAWSAVAPMIMAVFTMATTASGRSDVLINAGCSALILIGRKSVTAMKRLQRNIFVYIILAIIGCLALKTGYSFLAEHGYLNEKATEKYEAQVKSRKNKGVLAMIAAGRSEVFCGVYCAIRHNAFFGVGPWAIDTHGYIGDYLAEYGDVEDYEMYIKSVEYHAKVGDGKVRLIPAHSHIIGFWVYYGILTMPFWLYFIYLLYRQCRYNLAVVPQLYGYFALIIPSYMWHVMFSPYAGRGSVPLTIAIILICDAIRTGKLPMDPIMFETNVRGKDRRLK